MKFLFILQGDERGRLTQALALEEILLKNGHEVVEVLVGKSSAKTLPGFFNRNIQAPIKRYVSPDFFSEYNFKHTKWRKRVFYHIRLLPEYIKSILYIRKQIKKSNADVVINFSEVLAGLAYAVFPPQIHYFCIGHQYMFLHPTYEFPKNKSGIKLLLLRLLARVSSINCSKRLALSFQELEDAPQERLMVLPPLIRAEIFSLQPEQGGFVHGYTSDTRLVKKIAEDLALSIHSFRDERYDRDEEKEDPFNFYQMDDHKFLDYLASCKVYTSMAGFDSICEAMFLGKPVVMTSLHIEQECNAYHAERAGAGIVADTFDVNNLIEFVNSYEPNKGFIKWVESCEKRILEKFEKKINNNSEVDYSAEPNILDYETR